MAHWLTVGIEGPLDIGPGTPGGGGFFIPLGGNHDTVETYADGADLNNLNASARLGTSQVDFSGAYVSRQNPFGLNDFDTMESYTDLEILHGLNGGQLWPLAYVVHEGFLGLQDSDTMESYTDAASVNGLSGGSVWDGAYVDR